MKTKDFIRFGNTKIKYDIVYSNKRKNATLKVYPLMAVEISVPKDLSRKHIRQLVKNKSGWVIKQLTWFNELAQLKSDKEYVKGETYLYLGRQYRLDIKKDDMAPQTTILGKNLIINLPKNTEKDKIKKIVKVALLWWYKEQSENKIQEIIKSYSQKLGISKPKFVIKNQFKRWGSCTSKNLIIFNFRISMAPVSQIEYIVAHELCHTKIKDHSMAFWKLLSRAMPDYNTRKETLRKDGWQYSL